MEPCMGEGVVPMGKKVLIAIDDSENAMRAVTFVAETFSKDSEVTLFNVLQDTESICAYNSPSLTPYFQKERETFCSLEHKKKELVDNATEGARRSLVSAGFETGRVHVKTVLRTKGVARDIIREADSGYDVVVVGKRGLSAVQEFFFGSVSQKVLNGVKNASVLVVA